MQIKIEIDENYIAEIVSQEVARKIASEYTYELPFGTEVIINREAKKGIRDAVDKSIQKYIYSRKEEIIDRVIERASVEVVKKGLPKFIEAVGKLDETMKRYGFKVKRNKIGVLERKGSD